MPVTGHLKQPTQAAAGNRPCRLYLVLLPAGFTLPLPLPHAVRSYRTLSPLPFQAVCFLALSLESPRQTVSGAVFRGARTFLPARGRDHPLSDPKSDYSETDPRSSAAWRDTRHKPASSRHRPARPRMRPEMTLKSTDYSAHLRTDTIMGNIVAIGAQSLLQSRDRGSHHPASRSPPFRLYCLKLTDPFACERRPIQHFTGVYFAPQCDIGVPQHLVGLILWRAIMAFDKSTSAAICAGG